MQDIPGHIRWDLACLVEQVRSVCEITPNGCWLWRYSSVKGHRYPRLMIGGVRKHVSNWILEATGRPQPPGKEACHSCDEPLCCSPEHLRWDTHERNMGEMGDRGRAGPTRHPESRRWGPDHPWRLNPELQPRGPRTGNYASGDDHYTRRNPELVTWRGENHHLARLNPRKVREIRARRAHGERPDDIADSLGVGRTTVRAVLEGRTWKHVT